MLKAHEPVTLKAHTLVMLRALGALGALGVHRANSVARDSRTTVIRIWPG